MTTTYVPGLALVKKDGDTLTVADLGQVTDGLVTDTELAETLASYAAAATLEEAVAFNGSTADPGYCVLANGLYLQWGTATVSSSGSVQVEFAATFPNVVLSIQATPADLGDDVVASTPPRIYALTTSSCYIKGYAVDSSASYAEFNVYWFAIGY